MDRWTGSGEVDRWEGGRHARCPAGRGWQARAPATVCVRCVGGGRAPTPVALSCVQGVNVVTYVYELHGEEVKVKKIEHTKSQPKGVNLD